MPASDWARIGLLLHGRLLIACHRCGCRIWLSEHELARFDVCPHCGPLPESLPVLEP